MAYDRVAFSYALPGALGNVNPSNNIRRFILGWIIAEFGGQPNGDIGCANNPLAMADKPANHPGTSLCNNLGGGFGVLNFPSFNAGVSAIAHRLSGGLYPSVRHALATNDENNLGFNGHPMAGNIAGDLSVWVHGNRSPIATDYIRNIMTAAGNPNLQISGSSSGVDPNDICTACGKKGSPDYQKCLNQIAINHTVPACAQAAYNAAVQKNLVQPIKNALGVTCESIFGTGSPVCVYLNDPIRIIKIAVGLGLIGLAIFLLVTPEAYPITEQIGRTASKVGKGVKSTVKAGTSIGKGLS